MIYAYKKKNKLRLNGDNIFREIWNLNLYNTISLTDIWRAKFEKGFNKPRFESIEGIFFVD